MTKRPMDKPPADPEELQAEVLALKLVLQFLLGTMLLRDVLDAGELRFVMDSALNVASQGMRLEGSLQQIASDRVCRAIERIFAVTPTVLQASPVVFPDTSE